MRGLRQARPNESAGPHRARSLRDLGGGPATVLLLAWTCAACPGAGTKERTPARPAPRLGNGWNVLLITIDTLRADHLAAYGYRRKTSPHMDALAREGTLFDQAYTYWPKTRGSFVMIMTGRRPSQNGYSKLHPLVLDFNPTLASTLKDAGYTTAAVVDNPNLAAHLGYAKGFDRYRETWQELPEPDQEMERTRLITEDGAAFLAKPPPAPFFLWLHYVNPHAPYTPPAPFDRQFLDADAQKGPVLAPVDGFHGGVSKKWEVKGRRLGYYVAQYDGEVAAVDQEVGRVLDALAAGPAAGKTVVVLASDHGESLGEHDYYFDHGHDLFDPCLRIPLVVRVPGAPTGLRTSSLASTLDLVPTILDAVKVSYPPDLSGHSLLPEVLGHERDVPARLFAQNELHLSAVFDTRFKVVAKPEESGLRFGLYDRQADPLEVREAGRQDPEPLRTGRRDLEIFLERCDREWATIRRFTEGAKGEGAMSSEACEILRSLGYVDHCP